MSHFTVGAILPTTIPDDDVQATLEGLLERYSEHREVEPYQRPCWCVNHRARVHGNTMANNLVGTWEAKKQAFWEQPDIRAWQKELMAAARANDVETAAVLEAKQDDAWKSFMGDFRQQWNETQYDYETTSPDYAQPLSDCDDCHGTGMDTTTYNPDSKWDWWRVGGRWDGGITENPQSSENGFNFDAKHETIANNSALVSDLLQREELYTCYALLTPEGEWIGKGKMGWWGMSMGDASPDDWEQVSRSVYEQYADGHRLIVLDCHI